MLVYKSWEGTMSKFKFVVLPFLFLTWLGLMVLLNALGNPRLATVRGPDMLQLVAVGFCFGTAFGLAIVAFTISRRSKPI